MKERLYRFWRYFRDGYGIYISKPLSILNFLTITFYLLVDKLPFLKVFFHHFYVYLIVASSIFIPLSIFLGWFHMRKSRIYGVESILAIESNPLTVRSQRIAMDSTLAICEKLNVELSDDWHRLHNYWVKLDNKYKGKWKY
ncbi:MAG: hypothetical protein ACTSSG_11310 [Candidatus Heimdallarchaeaceae archaeon]